MKKLILTIVIALLITPACFASDNYIVYAGNASSTKPSKQIQNMEKEVRNFFKNQLVYTNTGNIEALKKMYTNKYINADGFDKETYFDLVQKTLKMYPDIKYTMDITKVSIIGNTAVVEIVEKATASSVEAVGETDITGYLKSYSNSIYYLEKNGDNWYITSDQIINERTTLTYGEANDIKMDLIVPQLVPANKPYTASLNIDVNDGKMIVIASIGQEKITSPQINSEESYRKLPESGILERIFTANKDNLNEYTVASIGITRAKLAKNKDVKLLVTGLGYIITRTNIIPEKNFKVVENGKKETTAKSVE